MIDLPLFNSPPPSVSGSVTSAAAADSLSRRALNQMHRDLLAYLATQPEGATDEDMQTALAMNPSTQRPRRIELVRRGLVVKVGEHKTKSGRRAAAWRVA